ncbi:cytochrome P450 [Hoeflea alexandrii]|uniref:cytochrome P450 n=1 Tax=Hoeflea alexandrii TaxID=288436 RepID=UPI0022AEB8E1|nr:cytochrome P450 [Hoeflea alexandrii]
MAADLVEKVLAAGRFDGIRDFGKPLVMRIIPDALGLPPEDRDNLLTYNYYLLKGRGAWRHLPWTDEELAESEKVTAWIARACERENLAPDGLGAQIYAAADAGEISSYEAGMLVRSFLSAGTDTTFGAIANTLNFLMTYRDQWDKLRDDPGLARNAYEEGMRFRGPAQIIARNTLDEMDYCGARMGKHDKVIAFVGSANRDPDRWEDPDSFQIERNANGHLALGVGIHGCVGQMVARMEAEKLLGELARCVPDMRIGPDGVEYSANGRVIEKLDLEILGHYA